MSDGEVRLDSPDSTPRLRQKYWLRTFAAFGVPNYRWFFGSLLCGFASMNMQMFVRGWLVFEITGSYQKLGWMTAAGGIVGLFAAPLGGVVADRVRQKKHVIQLSAIANGIIAMAIAYYITTGSLVFEHLLIASILQGITFNGMFPSKQALTKDVVGLDMLTNAIGLSNTGMNASRLLLPGLAGGMVSALGGGYGNIDPAKWVYILMGSLYILSVFLLIKVDVPDRPTATHGESVIEQLTGGFRYVLNTPVIFMLLGFNFLMAFFGMTYYMLLPGFVKDVLNAGPDKLGLIISVSGIGSLIGSLIIASLPSRSRARVLLGGTLIMGLALLAFSLSSNYWLSLVLLAIVGLGSVARMSLTNVLLQTLVDGDYRGRVMSIYMLEMAILSISIYPVSIAADVFGPQWAVGVSAVCLIVLVLVLFNVPSYRNLD
ncbi:MAG TPA: hypothetical protein DCM54_06880 [Gammaproteobacteria bacterium]|mgnify:CR=1 FL=1|nr:hypothetical protein [Gammaproteobacteria bacterium]|tara:strand:- start:924 stop:2213 length:1290 start_codon:yes stop_codon:yes gene_type:complete